MSGTGLTSAGMAMQAQGDGAPGGDDRPGVPHAHVVEDVAAFEAGESDGAVYRARWQLFLPTLAIAVLYSLAWLYLHATGKGELALTRLVVIVMAVGVPLLAAHAFLRYETIRLQLLAGAVRYHPGWPRDLPTDMPYELIERVQVKRGFSGRVFGGGTLVMYLTTGEKAAVADLANPEDARLQIEKRLNAIAVMAP